ncbi:hypothetical protein [Halomonas sp. H10-9-1]
MAHSWVKGEARGVLEQRQTSTPGERVEGGGLIYCGGYGTELDNGHDRLG